MNFRADLDTKLICKLYLIGWTMLELQKKFDCDYSTIKYRLKNTKIRNTKESVKKRKKFKKDYKYGSPRKYKLNENFFNEINPESSYIIGLIQADGYVDEERINITLKPSDKMLLLKILKLLDSKHKLNKYIGKYGNGIRLDINSIKISESLIKLGIKSPKSHTATTPKILLFNRDYWRGVIDGDGSLCFTKTGYQKLSLCGSKFVCNEFLNFCRKYNCGLSLNVRKLKNIFQVCLNGKDAIKISDILYKNSTIYLDRKYKTYLKMQDGNNETK